MNDYEAKVRQFHQAVGQQVSEPFSAKLIELRRTLIAEEVKELFAEFDKAIEELKTGSVTRKTKADLMKEMADVQYVLSGTAVTFGLPIDDVFDRVHTSNMSKLGPDGKPILRDDGKVMKGPDYFPPVLEDLA